MRDVLPDIQRWRGRGDRIALATVVSTRKSAPRPVGAQLAISERGELAGSVSGGCVENDVYSHACEVLAGAEPRLLSYGISDDLALSVGLPCGGEIDVFVEEPSNALLDRLVGVVEREERAVLLSIVEGESLGAELLVTATGEQLGEAPPELADVAGEALRAGRNRVLELPSGAKVFVHVFGPAPRLLVFGAVDTAQALCRAAKAIGWRTLVADARARFATRERLPSADEIVVAWPEDVLATVEPDDQTAVVVLTHDEKFDLPALRGALGSRRNQEQRRRRLREAGVAESELDRVYGPAGLDVGADSPAETALSILAEILAVRAGRAGGSLRDSSGRIHVDATAAVAS